MDDDLIVVTTGVVVVIIAIIAAFTIGSINGNEAQLNFERICVSHNRNVVYENVNDNLVSECK